MHTGHLKIIVKSMIKYTDSHCHIITLSANTPMIFGRICNAKYESDWEKLTQIASDKNFVCLGLHPWFLDGRSNDWDKKLYAALMCDPKVAVGEIGLDKHHPDMQTQQDVFITQLRIAYELSRPVHIHCVGAWERITGIFKRFGKTMPRMVITHSFNGDAEKISQMIEKYNMYFSYSGKQIARGDRKTIERIQMTPLDRILVESDTDTESNEISELDTALRGIGDIKSIPVADLSEQIYQNFQRVTQND